MVRGDISKLHKQLFESKELKDGNGNVVSRFSTYPLNEGVGLGLIKPHQAKRRITV